MNNDRRHKRWMSGWLLTSFTSIFFLATTPLSSWAASSSLSIQWDASQAPNVTNYTVRYGTASGSYSSAINVGTALSATVPNLTVGTTYYFAVTARDTTGMDSDPSNEVPFTSGNTAPTISSIGSQAINQGASTAAIGFTVGDLETSVGNLTLSQGSSNPTLVPVNNIVLAGSGASRTVTVTSVAGQTGTATITVGVSDGQLTTSTTFVLTVNAVNTAPTISSIANQTITEDAATSAIAFTVGDLDTAAGSLTLSKASSSTTLVPLNGIVFGGSGASRTVMVTPATNRNGTATISVIVSDGQLTATNKFVVTVTAVNDPPTISSIANQAISQDTSTAAIGFTVGDVDTATASLVLSQGSSNPALVPINNIVFGGSGVNRTVTVTPAAGQAGMSMITVTVSDGQLISSTVFMVTVSSSSATPAVYLTSPLDGASYVLATNIDLTAEASAGLSSISRVEFYEGETKIGEAALSPYTMTVSNVLVGSHTYTARAFAASGATNVSTPVTVNVGYLTSAADALSPTVTINALVDNSRTTNGTVTIKGTGRDNLKLAQVIYSINNSPFQAATGTTNWTVQANLLVGTNKVKIVGFDFKGNHSVTNVRTLIYVVTNGITLLTNGAGTINGGINRYVLEVARGYQLIAVPQPGNLFSNWTAGGVALGTNPVLNFQMISNLVLQANFVTNNFMSRKGVYTGLAYDTNNVTFTNAGFFRLTMTDRGAFSGATLLAGGMYPFTGRFWVDGRATVRIPRSGKPTLTGQLTNDLAGNNGISGTMSDGAFTVPLQADRATFAATNPAPYAGRYTMVVPGTSEVAGDGVGVVNMSLGGSVVMGGRLADGTVITRSAPVSRDGWWPLYVPLYTGKGMAISWVQFDTNGTKSMNGDAVWTKNPMPGKYYTNGFAMLTGVSGGRYVAPPPGPTNRVLNLTNATVSVSDGNLGAMISESVVLTDNSLLQIAGTTGMKLTINKANGMVNGSFIHPETKKVTAIQAVVQQSQTNIQGFFLGTNQSGRILLFP